MNLKKLNKNIYDSITITAKVYKDYWKCKTLNEVREIAYLIDYGSVKK